jgi:DNA repair protein RadC
MLRRRMRGKERSIASQADITLTRKLNEAGKLLEIQLLDHIILTTEGYYSFADEGFL